MKNRAAKRLFAWLMSTVMVVGEFGSMPMSVSANEGVVQTA